MFSEPRYLRRPLYHPWTSLCEAANGPRGNGWGARPNKIPSRHAVLRGIPTGGGPSQGDLPALPTKGLGPLSRGGATETGDFELQLRSVRGVISPLSRESHANVLFARGLCAPARVPQPTIGGRRCGVTLSIWPPPPRKPRFSIVSRRESKRWRRMDANARLCLLLICRMRRLETLRFQTLNRTLVQCSS